MRCLSAVDMKRDMDDSYVPFDPDLQFVMFLETHESEAEDVVTYLDQFSEKYKYPKTIKNKEGETIVHPTYFGVGDNLLRVSHPALYLKMYGLDALDPPYFGIDDIKIIYDNWNNIDNIIKEFQQKVDKLEK